MSDFWRTDLVSHDTRCLVFLLCCSTHTNTHTHHHMSAFTTCSSCHTSYLTEDQPISFVSDIARYPKVQHPVPAVVAPPQANHNRISVFDFMIQRFSNEDLKAERENATFIAESSRGKRYGVLNKGNINVNGIEDREQ